jgi:hypothetical protein
MRRYLPDFVFFSCLLLTLAIYYPGTHGYFQFDDTINILENTRIKIQSLDINSLTSAAYSGHAGFLQRPISVLSFALNYYFTGLDPYYFKLTNIVIHLLNGIGIYFLSRLLLGSHSKNNTSPIDSNTNRWIALAIASAWLLHPLNLTGVLYAVQRMTSLAAFFTICGMVSYSIGRSRQQNNLSGWVWIIVSFIAFTPLAILSKENGALLPPLLLLTELAFYRFHSPTIRDRRKLIALFSAAVLIPLIAIVIFTSIHPDWITSTYKMRDFTLVERCLTEARVIWFYIRLLFAPDISQFGLYHDDIPISHSLLDPLSTIFAVAGLAALSLVALLSLKRHPIIAFGLLFFLLGHSMESTLIPLELVHEHRNYLPDFGLLFILFYYCLYPLQHTQSLKIRRGLAIFIVLMFSALTFFRATQWGDPVQLKLKEVERHPNSIRTNIEVAHFYASIPPSSQENAQELYDKAYQHFIAASTLSPSDTLGLFGLIAINASKSIPIEPMWPTDLSNRLAKYPVAAHSSNSLASLNKCVLSKTCKGIDEVVETLFKALFTNPTLMGRGKIQTLFAWSEFLREIKHENVASFEAAKAAASIDPSDMDDQFNFAVNLINLGRFKEATDQIKFIRANDKLGAYSDKLNGLEKFIH